MQNKNNALTRRTLIGNSILAAAALGSGCTSVTTTGNIQKKRAFRFAHMTDIHMEPKKRAPQGLTAALKHIESLPDKPDMILPAATMLWIHWM